MLSGAALACVIAILASAYRPARAETRGDQLRVCADPNNLPFSDEKQQGFENRIAELVARDLGAKLSYVWWAQRRGFVRNTINQNQCDVLIDSCATPSIRISVTF